MLRTTLDPSSGARPGVLPFALVLPLALLACADSVDPRWALPGSVGLGSSHDHEAQPAQSEPLRFLAAGATEASVRDTIHSFEARSHVSLEYSFGAVGALRDRVLAGEPVDVVVVTPAVISALEAQQRVRAGSRVDLGQIGGGIAVRAGDPLPSIDTPEALKQALLDADEVYYADPAVATAGAALMKVVDTLGIGDQVRAKGHVAAGGKEAMENLTHSSAPRVIGATQISEIKSVPASQLVGEYPAPLQVKTTYAAVILDRTTRADDAAELTRFFVGPEFQARLAQSGFEPAAP